MQLHIARSIATALMDPHAEHWLVLPMFDQ
jgi:hypothetical protein